MSEQSATIKTQFPRLKSMWQTYWQKLNVQLPEIRLLPLVKDNFLKDIPYRLECIRTLQFAMTDLYYVIKTIVDALFNKYIEADLILDDYPESETIPVSFLISEILVGSLLQFIAMEKSLIPIGFLIIAKNKSMMKLKGRTIDQLFNDLYQNGFETTLDEISNVLNEMVELNYLIIEKDTTTGEDRYKFVHDFTLSPESQKKFQKEIRPLLEWAVEMWRSLYNIRSIDIIIPEFYPFRDFLVETVKRAATQGYSTAYNVIENIGNYYQLCIDQQQPVH